MKLRVFIYSLVLIFSLVPGEKLPFELKEERRFSGFEIYPIDVNHDKVDELLKVEKNNMQLFDQKGRFFWDFYFTPFLLKSVSACDYNKDGVEEIFLDHSQGLIEIVDCYRVTKPNDLINRLNTVTGIDRNHDGKWDGGVTAIDGIDANDDGNFDLLLKVDCGFDLQPRGLAVYDMKSGKELWHYWIGPAVDNVILEDLNNDGKPEIVIGTYSLANGSEANNTSDTVSYVIVLDRNGKLLWERKIGNYFTCTLIAVSDIDQDREKEVIATQSSSKGESEELDKIIIFEGNNGTKKRFNNTGENFWGMICYDLNHDGRDEIITGNSDNEIRVFNSDLDEIKSFTNNVGIDIMGASDLTGDGHKEIIAAAEDDKLIIFDYKLKKIVQLQMDRNFLHDRFNKSYGAINPVRNNKEKKLLIRNANKDESDFVIYRFNPAPFVKKLNNLTIILLFIVILALTNVFILNRLWTYTVVVAKRYYSKVNEIGYIILNSNGKVRLANERSETLLGIDNLENQNLLKKLTEFGLDEINHKLQNLRQFENALITIRKDEEEEKVLSLNFYKMPLPRTFTLRIEDVTKYEHLARIESWAPVAQKLAHGMKTPLMNLQLGIQQVESGCNQIDRKTQGIIENLNAEIDRLRKLTDNFMKFTQLTPPTLTSENINEILKDLVNRYSLTFPPEIKIQLNLNQELPKTMLDRREIENAFTIIINNAIESMKKTGILSIATSLQQHFEEKIKNSLQLIIADTGKGIPERYIKDLFTPYFVYEKPNGTGLGLPLAKKIIEDHKGTIEIKSKEGIGTTVIINLPVVS